MIVDVLRNDISEVCKPGTVKVSRLAELETYNNVHHLVSDIEGTLSKGMNIFDVIKHCMPGGSVTGAPKVRAMQIISELETFKRGVYCGAIGFISLNGYADFNIPSRKLVVEVHGRQHYEFNEFYHKTKRGYQKSRARDRDKIAWCQLNDIDIVILKYSETENEWTNRILNR